MPLIQPSGDRDLRPTIKMKWTWDVLSGEPNSPSRVHCSHPSVTLAHDSSGVVWAFITISVTTTRVGEREWGERTMIPILGCERVPTISIIMTKVKVDCNYFLPNVKKREHSKRWERSCNHNAVSAKTLTSLMHLWVDMRIKFSKTGWYFFRRCEQELRICNNCGTNCSIIFFIIFFQLNWEKIKTSLIIHK